MNWRSIALSALIVIATIGLALLFFEQLSLRAAIRGGLFALIGMVFSRVAVWWWQKRRRGK